MIASETTDLKKAFVDIDKLQETSEIKLPIEYDGLDDRFVNFLNNTASTNSITGLIGDFGSGKSVFLNQIRDEKYTESDSKWILFDAWKFPERRNLWDGFLLEIAKQITDKDFKEILSEIEGSQDDKKKALISTAADMGTALLQLGNPFFNMPTLDVLKNANSLLDVSPAKRLFDFQNILLKFLDKSKVSKNIFIVVEDIDRSSDYGIFFLETLKNFLDNLPDGFSKKIKVIVPISPKNLKNKFDSYLKCLDFQFDFELPKGSLTEFVDTFCELSEEKERKDLVFFLEDLQNYASMRLIKYILRKTEGRIYELSERNRDKKIQWQVTLGLEVLKYFSDVDEDSTTFFDIIRKNNGFKNIKNTGGIISSVQKIMLRSSTSGMLMYEYKEMRLLHNFFVEEGGAEFQFRSPGSNSFFEGSKGYYIPEFYLK